MTAVESEERGVVGVGPFGRGSSPAGQGTFGNRRLCHSAVTPSKQGRDEPRFPSWVSGGLLDGSSQPVKCSSASGTAVS